MRVKVVVMDLPDYCVGFTAKGKVMMNARRINEDEVHREHGQAFSNQPMLSQQTFGQETRSSTRLAAEG